MMNRMKHPDESELEQGKAYTRDPDSNPFPRLTSLMMGIDPKPKPQMVTPYRCDTCGKYFTQKPGLKKHIRIHTGERPYKCPICNRGFTQSSSCKIHLRTHTGEKPHKCHICGRCFPHSSTLVNHIRGHTGEKCYKCQWCGRAFTCRNYLRTHIRVHTGERPYKCVDCGKAFSQLSNLMQHNRDIHTKEKRFKCEICERAFGRLETLQCHLRTHLGEKRYKCGVCQRNFSQRPLLKLHYHSHFGNALTETQEKLLLDASGTTMEECFRENSDESGMPGLISPTPGLSMISSSPAIPSPIPNMTSQMTSFLSSTEHVRDQMSHDQMMSRDQMSRDQMMSRDRIISRDQLMSRGSENSGCEMKFNSGLESLAMPLAPDIELVTAENITNIYALCGAAITSNLIIWTLITMHHVKNYHVVLSIARQIHPFSLLMM